MADIPNVILIIFLLVIPIIVFFITLLFIVVYQSKMDRFQACLPKIIVMIGMSLASCAILVLPFDVWNTTQRGNLDVALPIIWQVLFGIIAIFVVFIIPFTFCYYENYDSERTNNCAMQIMWGLIYAFGFTILVCLFGGISYIWFGDAEVPVTFYRTSNAFSTVAEASADIKNFDTGSTYLYGSYNIKMSIVIYMVAILSIVGWVIFVICGGCGLSALPIGLTLKVCFERPRFISAEEYAVAQKSWAEEADKLIRIGMEIEKERKAGRKKAKGLRSMKKTYKQAVIDLEDRYKRVTNQFKYQGVNVPYYLGTTVLGIICAIITILWVVHLVLFKLPGSDKYVIWPFLNMFFIWLDVYVYSLVGLIAYSIFAYYLVIAVLYGNLAICQRLPFFGIYPLKRGDTLLTSFLVNTGITMLVSITVVQFCCDAFSVYVKGTAIGAMFNVYIYYMKWIGYFYRYVHYVFFAFILIGIVMSIIFSFIKTDHQKKLAKALEQVQKSQLA